MSIPLGCQKVLLALRKYGCLNQKSIILETGLSERCVRDCLKRLIRARMLLEQINVHDIRVRLYELSAAVEGFIKSEIKHKVWLNPPKRTLE